jgi:hypothetical protein
MYFTEYIYKEKPTDKELFDLKLSWKDTGSILIDITSPPFLFIAFAN